MLTTLYDMPRRLSAAENAAGSFFCIIGNFVSYDTKTLRVDAHCARMEDVAYATALGARVSQARLFLVSVLS